MTEASPLMSPTRKDLLSLDRAPLDSSGDHHSISPLLRHTPPKRYSEQWLESESPLSQKQPVVDAHGWVWDDRDGWVWTNATTAPVFYDNDSNLLYVLWFILGVLTVV